MKPFLAATGQTLVDLLVAAGLLVIGKLCYLGLVALVQALEAAADAIRATIGS